MGNMYSFNRLDAQCEGNVNKYSGPFVLFVAAQVLANCDSMTCSLYDHNVLFVGGVGNIPHTSFDEQQDWSLGKQR